jgi:hypothetical protein
MYVFDFERVFPSLVEFQLGSTSDPNLLDFLGQVTEIIEGTVG